MKVWVDFTNTAHVQVLRPLVELLEEQGHEVELTARPLSQTIAMLDRWGRHAEVIGHHGGAGRLGKAEAAASRVPALLRWARGRGIDRGLAHGSTDLPPVCRLLRVPNTTMFDYEWASLQHHVNCRLATRVLVPDAIPAGRLARYGAKPPKLVRYPGLKEEYFLADFEPDPAVLEQVGAEPAQIVCVIRTAPSYALYLGGSENPLLPRLLQRISRRRRRAGHRRQPHPRAGGRDRRARPAARARPPRDGRRPQPGRARRPARLRGWNHEPRGSGARHAGLVDLRGARPAPSTSS